MAIVYELKDARGPKVRPGQERDPSSSNCSSLSAFHNARPCKRWQRFHIPPLKGCCTGGLWCGLLRVAELSALVTAEYQVWDYMGHCM